MKRVLILLVLLVFACPLSSGAEAVFGDTFEITSSGEGVQIRQVIAMPGQRFAVLGVERASGRGARGVLQCIDSTGGALWRYASPSEDSAFQGVVCLADGTLVLLHELSFSDEEGNHLRTAWELVFVRDGEAVGSKALEHASVGRRPGLFPAEDGFFVVSGERAEGYEEGPADSFPTVQRFTGLGEVVWTYQFTDELPLVAGVEPLGDAYVFYGSMVDRASQGRERSAWIACVGQGGEAVWRAEIQGESWPMVYGVAGTGDGGILAVFGTAKTEVEDGVALPDRYFTARVSVEGEVMAVEEKAPGESPYRIGRFLRTGGGNLSLVSDDAEQANLRLAVFGEAGEIVQAYPVGYLGERGKSTHSLLAGGEQVYLLERYTPEMDGYAEYFVTRIDLDVLAPAQ